MKLVSTAAQRYAAWIDRRRREVIAVAILVTLIGTYLAAQLPVETDLTRLLPPSEPSVRDLAELQDRTRSIGSVIAAIDSTDPAIRQRAAQRLAERVRGLGPTMVGTVTVDDGDARRFAWEHRFLFAPLEDLVAARDGLKQRILEEKLEANPLYIPLDDEEDEAQAAPAPKPGLTALRDKLREAEAKAKQPEGLVSSDGTLQLILIHAPFASSNVAEGREMVEALRRVAAETQAEIGHGVTIGLADDIITGVAEERAILRGMLMAVLLTVSVVGFSLLLYYRSGLAVLGLLGSLAVGVILTFAFTRLTIGHLNSASAFLSAIVIGNGINVGIIVLARHLEERRHGRPWQEALATALSGSFTGTLTAAVAAGVSYASLIITDFLAFHDFGIIAAVGMCFCWLSAYTVLPAILCVLERRGRVKAHHEPLIGKLLVRLLPRNLTAVAIVSGLVFASAGGLAYHYLASDPYEYYWGRLRADSDEALEARRWMRRIDKAFGQGLSSGFVIGVERPEDAAKVEAILRAHSDPAVPESQALFRKVSTIQGALPADQPQKIAVLAELRELMNDETLSLLSDEERADAERLRPPPDLRPLTIDEIPEAFIPQFVEQDGTRGRLLFADQAHRFNGWNGRDMLVFSRAVRALDFPPDTHLGGSAFVFADILTAVTRDGPRATAFATVGVILFVFLLVGVSRDAVIILVCAVAGTAAMLAGAWLFGLKVNFLDFVALPITLGISVDYSVNVVARARGETADIGRRALATTGGAVVLCSWTTIVGYGSLLLSENAGIRSFGLAAILGEATCLVAAITLAPALLHVFSRRNPSPAA